MVDTGKLYYALLEANHLTVNGVGTDIDGVTIRLTFYESATQPQKDAANAYLATLLSNPYFSQLRKPRDLRLIVADLDTLSPANKSAIWAAISAGNPPRWTKSNQGEVWAMLRLSESGALSVAQQTTMRITAVAMYIRNENPPFLINPSFAPTVNVPGDEVA